MCARPRIRGGLRRRGRREFRADRQWRHRRGAGHRREERLQRSAVLGAAAPRAKGHRRIERTAEEGARSLMPRRFTEKKLILASHNKGKAKEIAELLAPFAIE